MAAKRKPPKQRAAVIAAVINGRALLPKSVKSWTWAVIDSLNAWFRR